MTGPSILATLCEVDHYKARRAAYWAENVEYWLRGPLRHVVDVGGYIADRVEGACRKSSHERPLVVDMGFGDGWLLRSLRQRAFRFAYIGLDCSEAFVEHARRHYADSPHTRFELVDVEESFDLRIQADVVVNAFNFFELYALDQPFANASRMLRSGGVLQVATIDKTYLLLALSRGWDELKENLRCYQVLPGTKYAFQPVDLGDGVSESLYYPSVLYSSEDFLDAATDNGLTLSRYKEHVFTASLVPKIYCHYEFIK